MLLESFAEAIRNVRAHWLRVVLTGSGIVWGIALFVSLNAAGTSFGGGAASLTRARSGASARGENCGCGATFAISFTAG